LAAGGFKELRRALDGADRGAGGLRLRGWATGYFRFAQAEPALFALMSDPAVADLPPVAEARAALLAGLRRIVEEVAVAQGRVDPPIHQITLAVWAAAHGAATLSPGEPGQPELIDEVIAGLTSLFQPPRG
jgi:hypothetical protein